MKNNCNYKLTLIFLALITLVACSDSSSTARNKTQVVAQVNDEEITVHQVNEVLKTISGRAINTNQAEITAEILNGLIDQSVVVQEAHKIKLDRDPIVVQAIESTKRRIIMDAYLERSIGQAKAPTIKEIADYYAVHPELFSQRKLYIYKQLTLSLDSEKSVKIIDKVKGVEKLDDFILWLTKNQLEFSVTPVAKTAEALPTVLLLPLTKLKVGDVGYLKVTDGLLVIELNQIIPQPIDFEQATPAIKRYLTAQHRQVAVKDGIAKLRAAATVNYMGGFTQAAKYDLSEKQDINNKIEEDSIDLPLDGSHIERGLKGLK